MFKILKAVVVISVLAVSLAGCAPQVQVPPAYVGKILTKDGYKPETVTPSKFRLEYCMVYCDQLILLQASDQSKTEPFQIFLPKDQLNMKLDVRMTLSVNKDMIEFIYDKVPAKGSVISFDDIYDTYAMPVVRDVIRQVVTKYTINEIASSREQVSAELNAAVGRALSDKPIILQNLGLADVQFPPVITQAKEKAAERREQIEREKAQLELQRVTMERDLEQAKMQRAIDREKAEATKEVNEILSKSVTDKYLAYRSLEVLEKLAVSENKEFVPMEAVGTLGLQQAIFQQEMTKASVQTAKASVKSSGGDKGE